MIDLRHGDCLEIMPTIPDGSVDMILSDPPYPDYYVSEFSYHDRILDVFKNYSCRQFIFWTAKEPFPLEYTARHIWDKITGAACQYDFIYERNGGKRQKIFRGHRINSTVSAQFAREKFTGHKSQKPLNVLAEIILYSECTGTVFDPYMGSGGTGVACKNLNRSFIGIEKDAKYFEIAQKRIYGTMPQEKLAI